jgi:hypothetical protein
MKVYFLDTRALGKRYHRERGSEEIDALFAEQDRQIIISDPSIIELGQPWPKRCVKEKSPSKNIVALLASSVRIL